MSKRPKVEPDSRPLTSNPFAALVRDDVPDAPRPIEVEIEIEADDEPSSSASVDLGPRLVVRRQKKGQRGKTATVVEGLGAPAMLELLPRIKREFGCSARIEGDVLIAGTGDHVRIATWLRRAGATRVIVGN